MNTDRDVQQLLNVTRDILQLAAVGVRQAANNSSPDKLFYLTVAVLVLYSLYRFAKRYCYNLRCRSTDESETDREDVRLRDYIGNAPRYHVRDFIGYRPTASNQICGASSVRTTHDTAV